MNARDAMPVGGTLTVSAAVAMVYGLAAQSGGAFVLESQPGAGTTAALWLPVATQDAHAVQATEPRAVPATERATVLLVDDEDLVRAAIAEGLRELGYDVVEAASAAAALDKARAGLAPDILVTDHMMPGMTGAQLAAELRAVLPALPVLMITGYANLPADQARGLAVLAKPFREAELAARVAGLLDRARTARRRPGEAAGGAVAPTPPARTATTGWAARRGRVDAHPPLCAGDVRATC